jgi:hypothetical protein
VGHSGAPYLSEGPQRAVPGCPQRSCRQGAGVPVRCGLLFQRHFWCCVSDITRVTFGSLISNVFFNCALASVAKDRSPAMSPCSFLLFFPPPPPQAQQLRFLLYWHLQHLHTGRRLRYLTLHPLRLKNIRLYTINTAKGHVERILGQHVLRKTVWKCP